LYNNSLVDNMEVLTIAAGVPEGSREDPVSSTDTHLSATELLNNRRTSTEEMKLEKAIREPSGFIFEGRRPEVGGRCRAGAAKGKKTARN
jgi:hypothetical protein